MIICLLTQNIVKCITVLGCYYSTYFNIESQGCTEGGGGSGGPQTLYFIYEKSFNSKHNLVS